MNVLFNLSENRGWGDRSWFIPHAAWYAKQGHKVFIVCGQWGQVHNPDYNPLIPEKTRGLRPDKPSKYMVYNPTLEPLDFFINLICPSLNCEFWDLPTGMMTSGWAELEGSPNLQRQDFGFKFDKVVKLNYLAYQWDKNVTKFDFKISRHLLNTDYYLVENELKKTKNILLLSTWDDSYLYEPRKSRSKGSMLLEDGYDQEFYNVVNFWDYKLNVIKKIDEFCVKNPEYRIIIANKKAQDWTRQGFIKSNYFDMRVFENYNITFSQALHVMANNSKGLISYINSFQSWMCNAANLNTILWYPTYTYKEAICKENPEGTLTAVVMNLPRYLSNPRDISEEQILKLFEGTK